MLDVSEQETETGDTDTWALAEGGTFTNQLVGSVSITGRKIWSGLPSGFVQADLPDVSFAMRRYVMPDDLNKDAAEDGRVWDKKPAATFTITSEDWEQLYQNGSYQFIIEYAGDNQRLNGNKFRPEGSTEEDWTQLPRYDEEGRLYHYVLDEVSMGGDKWTVGIDGGLVFEITSGTGTHIVNNRYKEDQGGSLKIKKLLKLPRSKK